MDNSDIIICTSSNQLNCLITDDLSITIYYKHSLYGKVKSVRMSKGIFVRMLDEFCNDSNFEAHYGTFTSPNADEKD